MERIVKLIQKGNLHWSVGKDGGRSKSFESKIWCRCKRNGAVKKRKHIDR